MIREIHERRSIRRFQNRPVDKSDVIEILQSAIKAPSSKNRQPWRYIVVQNDAKHEMLAAFRRGIAREEAGRALLPESKRHLSGAKYSVQIMEQAPVIVLAVNPLGRDMLAALTPEERIYEVCNMQSIGASIQNLLLAATEKGLGSLWICDIFFAHAELREWLNVEGALIAAVALGYPDESPAERPRKNLESVVEWRD